MSAEQPTADDRAARLEGLLAQHAWVRALARRLVRSDADADDLAQDAWLAAMRSPPAATGPAGSVRAWFGTVLRNASRQTHRGDTRRRHREDEASRPEATPSSSQSHEIVGRAEEHRRVVDAVLALEEPARTAVLLRFFDDLPPREVAARTGVPLETARARIRRALERLRESLDSVHGGDGSSWRAALLPLAGLPAEWSALGGSAGQALTAGAKSGTTASAASSSSFTTGVLTMAATTTTVAVAVLGLTAGAAIAWMAGADDRNALADLRSEAAAGAAAAGRANAEAADAREATKRAESRVSSLEADLRRESDARKAAEERVSALTTELAQARTPPGPAAAAPRPSGPAFAYAEFDSALGKVDWRSVAEHTTGMVAPTREIVRAILAGEDLPLKAAGEAQRHNGPLIQAVGTIVGQIPGTGVNGAYTHPAFQVNAIAAALEEIGKPLTAEQKTALDATGRRFTDEETRRAASYGETTFQIQKLVEEGALKDRFFNAVRGILAQDQLDAISPVEVRDRTSADLWSEGLFWAQFARPVDYQRREQLNEAVTRMLTATLKLDEAQKAKAAAVAADWSSRLPTELTGRKPDALEKIRMFPADLVARAAVETRSLLERVANDLALSGDQLAAARRFGVVLYPFPAEAGE